MYNNLLYTTTTVAQQPVCNARANDKLNTIENEEEKLQLFSQPENSPAQGAERTHLIQTRTQAAGLVCCY
jgi:hypothetical protein